MTANTILAYATSRAADKKLERGLTYPRNGVSITRKIPVWALHRLKSFRLRGGIIEVGNNSHAAAFLFLRGQTLKKDSLKI